jgi:hypothetical protein
LSGFIFVAFFATNRLGNYGVSKSTRFNFLGPSEATVCPIPEFRCRSDERAEDKICALDNISIGRDSVAYVLREKASRDKKCCYITQRNLNKNFCHGAAFIEWTHTVVGEKVRYEISEPHLVVSAA